MPISQITDTDLAQAIRVHDELVELGKVLMRDASDTDSLLDTLWDARDAFARVWLSLGHGA